MSPCEAAASVVASGLEVAMTSTTADTLNAAMSEAYREPDVKAYFSRIGQDMMGGSPEQFAQLLSREVDTWSKLLRSANIEFE